MGLRMGGSLRTDEVSHNLNRMIMFTINTRQEVSLNLDNITNILSTRNKFNRPMKRTLVEKYKKAMRSGNWDWDFYEGKTLVFDGNGDALSSQHRLQAAKELMEEGKFPMDTWDVYIEYVDRSVWLANSVEKRTAADRLAMRVANQFPSELNVGMSKLSGQYSHITEGYSSTSGAGGRKKLTEDDLAASADEAMTFWENLPVGMRAEKEMMYALLCLFMTGNLTVDDLRLVEDINTRVGSGRAWLRSIGFGSAIKSLPYAIAVLKHASDTNINSNYTLISEDYKPMYVKTGKYVFSDYQ